MISIFNSAWFLKKARRAMRSGEFSREPLTLLRLEWRPGLVECDWMMRPADPWDKDLPQHVARENQTMQALRDALTLRNMIFKSFPSVRTAELRMYGRDEDEQLELMMTGSIGRSDEVFERVPSMAMRAKLCGFQFTLAQGALQRRS